MTWSERVERFLECDVRCYHCARVVGQLRYAEHTSAVFLRAGDGRARPIASLALLRCNYCRGPLYVDATDAEVRYHLGAQRLERPRRGRPPKRPVEALDTRTA